MMHNKKQLMTYLIFYFHFFGVLLIYQVELNISIWQGLKMLR